jgi:hypothetical protein
VNLNKNNNLHHSDKSGKAVWHTNTASPTGDSTTTLHVQNDGNCVLYKGTSIWATNTAK